MPRSGPGPMIGSPSTDTSPMVAVSRPPAMLSRVDLPQPEVPTMQTSSPASTWRSTGPTATTGFVLRRAGKVLMTRTMSSLRAPTGGGPAGSGSGAGAGGISGSAGASGTAGAASERVTVTAGPRGR